MHNLRSTSPCGRRLVRPVGLLLAFGAAHASATAVPAGAQAAVRETLLSQAAASGLRDATLSVHIAEPQRAVAACPVPLDFRLSGQHLSRLRLLARCAPHGTVTAMNVRAELLATVVVAVRGIAPRQPFDAASVATRRTRLESLSRPFVSLDATIGQVSRHRLRAGAVVLADDIAAAELVRRGQAVRLVSGTSTVAVSAAGTALRGGKLGDLIEVRNDSSERTLRARVTAPGEVQVVTEPAAP
ncbi:flagellar basal body P-ring formation chaperone FlgA [Chitinasiproducens palmae]|nr:flagellar basal body P-ring formation chaperone FlgA [Chitinasiproducens palmae]